MFFVCRHWHLVASFEVHVWRVVLPCQPIPAHAYTRFCTPPFLDLKRGTCNMHVQTNESQTWETIKCKMENQVVLSIYYIITWFSILQWALDEPRTQRPGDGPIISNHFSSVKSHAVMVRSKFSRESPSNFWQNSTRLYFCAGVRTSVCHGFCHLKPNFTANFRKLDALALRRRVWHSCKARLMLALFISQILSKTCFTCGLSETGFCLDFPTDLWSRINPGVRPASPFWTASLTRLITRET